MLISIKFLLKDYFPRNIIYRVGGKYGNFLSICFCNYIIIDGYEPDGMFLSGRNRRSIWAGGELRCQFTDE